MRFLRAVVAAVVTAGVVTPVASAQMYFGQNQVQYGSWDWQVIQTEHFLIHYYPEMGQAALDAALMAERGYARLSSILNHQFREPKPIILFSSRGHFGQNHVTGDLGEGTGGVTEGIRHRVLLPFTGDYHSFERVLVHEMVHSFQYDIFSRGRAAGGLALLQQANPPLWFIEGMAEYLALGSNHPLTDAWIRDAAINGKLPTLEQMEDPSAYFPYRYGESVMQYIASKWGEQAIGRVLQAVPGMGVPRAIQRELVISYEDLGEDWREAMQATHLPDLPNRQRPRSFAAQLLTTRRSGGAADIFLAPVLSSDGKKIAFLSTGSVARGEVFIDLWLGDAVTGKRIRRLVKSVLDPNFEELRLLYSQSSFSPDGKFLAFTAQREGRDVLYILEVDRRKAPRLIDIPNLDVVMSPAFSPDGGRLVFSGSVGGTSDLYVVNVDGTGLERLTNDRNGDLQPQWSPDGTRIVFASERAPGTNFETLKLEKWQIATYTFATKAVEVLPQQGGLNLNPMWSADSRAVAYISDRTGTANIFLYEFDDREHYQLTDVVGSVSAVTEFSPAISWARIADKLAFTYFDDGNYNVWTTDNPRRLKKAPFRQADVRQIVASAAGSGGTIRSPGATRAAIVPTSSTDSMTTSLYRSGQTFRPSSNLADASMARVTTTPADSSPYTLADTNRFRRYDYKGRLEAEMLSRPSIGYSPDNFGQGVYGQSVLILSDMLGNHQMALAGGLNGSLSEAQFFGVYSNLSRRLQYSTGVQQDPVFYSSSYTRTDLGGGILRESQGLNRYIYRSVFASAQYPLDRFRRVELGLSYSHVDRAAMTISRDIAPAQGVATNWFIESTENQPGVSFLRPMVAYVQDNTLFGYTGPIMGTRLRAQVEPAIGGLRWMSYFLDARKYEPLVFNFITLAGRVQTRISTGRDEEALPAYIGDPGLFRGYNRNNFTSNCEFTDIANPECSASRLLGSRVFVGSAEVRFPLVRNFQLGFLPIGLPPIDGLAFFDVGMAWNGGDNTSFFSRVPAEQAPITRYPLRSYGYGLRLNLYNIALLRWDYAIPLDLNRRKGFWSFSIGPSW